MDKRLDWDYFDGLVFAIDQPNQFWNHHIITHILSHLIECRCNKPDLSNFYPYKAKCIYGIQNNKIVSAPIDDDITPPYRVAKDWGSRGPSISPVICGMNNWILPRYPIPIDISNTSRWDYQFDYLWGPWIKKLDTMNHIFKQAQADLIWSMIKGFADYMSQDIHNIYGTEYKFIYKGPLEKDSYGFVKYFDDLTFDGNYIIYFDIALSGNEVTLVLRTSEVRSGVNMIGGHPQTYVDLDMPRFEHPSVDEIDRIIGDSSFVPICRKDSAEILTDCIYVLYIHPAAHYQELLDFKKEYNENISAFVNWDLKSEGDLLYKYEDKLQNNKVKPTKQLKSMATKQMSMFERMFNKWKQQFSLNKLDGGIVLTMDGHIALAAGDGVYRAIVDGRIEEYPEEAVFEMQFYSMFRPVNQIRVGDHIFMERGDGSGVALCQVLDVEGNNLSVLRFNGDTNVRVATTDKLTGLSTVEVLINMFDPKNGLMNFGQNNPMGQMALMMAMSKEGKMDFEKMFAMSMMMGGNNPFQSMCGGQMNQMMPMMFAMSMAKGDGKMDFEKMFAMSMMMGGNNPFQGMFQSMQTPQAETKPTRKTRSDKGTKKTRPVDEENPEIPEVPETPEVPENE